MLQVHGAQVQDLFIKGLEIFEVGKAAKALRKCAWKGARQAGVRHRWSTCSSGVSSKKAEAMSCVSVRTAFDERASITSEYCPAERRSCHGIQ